MATLTFTQLLYSAFGFHEFEFSVTLCLQRPYELSQGRGAQAGHLDFQQLLSSPQRED